MWGVKVGSVVTLAALAGVLAMSGTADGGSACSRAVANAAIRLVKPRIAMLTHTPMLIRPADADELICFDFTRDGRADLAVTVASGGSAGDVGWFVLVRTRTGWRLAHGQGGYKIGLFRVGRELVDSQPVYRKNDPNCCPTGGFDHQRWHWNGHRFVLEGSWHSTRFPT